MVRVADLRHELGKLLQRLGLGLLAQPGGVGDGDAVGVDEVGDQLFHAPLGGFGEVTFHILTADVFAADAVDERNTAFPTVALLLLAGKHLAVEVEVGVVELMRQFQRGSDDHMDAGPQFEVIQIGGGPEGVEAFDEARFMHDCAGEASCEINRLRRGRGGGVVRLLPGLDPGIQAIVGKHGAQLGMTGGVIGLLRITGGDIVPVVRGDCRLDFKEASGLGFGLIVGFDEFGVGELLGHHLDVGFADRCVMIRAIVGLIRQSETGLFDVDDVGLRGAGIAIDGDAE